MDFAFVTGESIDKVAKEIVKLSEDPAKAVQKLNEQYHFLTLAQYDYIAALEKQGDKDGATTTALQALDDAMKKRAQSIQDSMGTLARIWHDGLKNMAQDWNDFKTYIDDIGNNSLAS